MTKTQKSVFAGMAALGLACCITGTAVGVHLVAGAAEAFAATSEGNALYFGGRSEQEILAAFNRKVAQMNEAIDEAVAAGKDLAQAYADGDILAYSIAEGSGGKIDSENKRSGWKVWDAAPLVDLKKMQSGYSGWGSQDQYINALQYDGVKDTAYIVTGEFAAKFYDSNNKLGSALGDAFAATSTEGSTVRYQNFTGGYIKSENGNASVVWYKNVEVNGTQDGVSEVSANATASGFVGAPDSEVVTKAGGDGAAVARAFTDAYERYAQAGFNVGYPFSGVTTKYTLTTQDFRGGDSASSPWGDDRSNWAFLAYNYEEGRAYLIKDEFQYVFENGGDFQNAAKSLGDPVGDDYVAGGNRYQNFTNGYMKADGETPSNQNVSAVVTGKHVNEQGEEVEIGVTERIGKTGPSVTADDLPDGIGSLAELTAAFKAAYEEKVEYASGEKLASVELVVYKDGYLSQKYIDNNNAEHVLAYSEASGTFVYFRPAVVSKIMSSLGSPSAERVEVAAVDGQSVYAYPFANGYVKLVVSRQEKIQGGEVVTVINESAVATEGATFDREKVFFETVSYSSNITAGMISHVTSGDNASVDAAYWSIWGKEQPSDEAIAGAFKAAYDEAFEVGFSAGTPSPEGIMFWKSGNSGVIKLTLKGGNGNANFWGDNTLMTYNPMEGKVYITTGAVANCYAHEGASGNGWATTEMKINTKTGDIVQQFDITDTVVENRQIYIIVTGGTANKVSGVYDFEANRNGGEWVNYLTQFGGSISSKPVTLDAYKAGDAVNVDFSEFITNEDGYFLTWNLVSENGTLSKDGVFTLESMASEDVEVRVEVYSAFDKLTLAATLKAAAEGGDQPVQPENPENPENPESPDNSRGG